MIENFAKTFRNKINPDQQNWFYISNFQETIKCSIIFSQTTNGLDRKQWHLYLKKKIIEELKTLRETFLVIYFNRNIMHSTLW